MSDPLIFPDDALRLGLKPDEFAILNEVFAQVGRGTKVSFVQAVMATSAPTTYAAASQRAWRMRKRIMDHPDGREWLMQMMGVTPERRDQVVAEAMEAVKYVTLPGGKVRKVADHNTRLNAVKLAAQLSGDLRAELPDADQLSQARANQIASQLNLKRVEPPDGQ